MEKDWEEWFQENLSEKKHKMLVKLQSAAECVSKSSRVKY